MTGNNLKALDLIMEDGKCVTVPADLIGSLHIWQNANEVIHSDGSTSTSYIVHGFAMSIDREFKNAEHLQMPNDFVKIRRTFKNGEQKYGICSPITGYNGYLLDFNSNICNKTNKHGDIFWGVYKDADVRWLDDIFPDKIINEDDYTVFDINQE